MITGVINAFLLAAVESAPFGIYDVGTPAGTNGIGIANPTAATPVNPTHVSGDTLLCLAFCRGASPGPGPTLTVSGSGWVDATGVTNPLNADGNSTYLFMNECDSSSEANPTVTPSSAVGSGTHAVVIRIRGRTFGADFNWGLVGTGGTNSNQIRFSANSPSIDDGNAILAFGIKRNDYQVGDAGLIQSITAGLTWEELIDIQTNVGFDTSWVVDWALNETGSSYNTGTGGYITGFTLSVSATSVGVYLEICKT